MNYESFEVVIKWRNFANFKTSYQKVKEKIAKTNKNNQSFLGNVEVTF